MAYKTGNYKNQKSGHYLFIPGKEKIRFDDNVTAMYIIQGKILTQLTIITSKVMTRIYFFPQKDEIEIETQIISQKLKGSFGLDVTLNIVTGDIDSNRTFYTDDNGLIMNKRV